MRSIRIFSQGANQAIASALLVLHGVLRARATLVPQHFRFLEGVLADRAAVAHVIWGALARQFVGEKTSAEVVTPRHRLDTWRGGRRRLQRRR